MTGQAWLDGSAEGLQGHQLTGRELLELLQQAPASVLDSKVAAFGNDGNSHPVIGVFVADQARIIQGRDNMLVREDRVLSFTIGDYTPTTYV